jgi:hypothetical protein
MTITASVSIFIPPVGQTIKKNNLCYFGFWLTEIVQMLVSLSNSRKNLLVASLDVPVGMRLMPLWSSVIKEVVPTNAAKTYDSINSKVNSDDPPTPYTHAHTCQ